MYELEIERLERANNDQNQNNSKNYILIQPDKSTDLHNQNFCSDKVQNAAIINLISQINNENPVTHNSTIDLALKEKFFLTNQSETNNTKTNKNYFNKELVSLNVIILR